MSTSRARIVYFISMNHESGIMTPKMIPIVMKSFIQRISQKVHNSIELPICEYMPLSGVTLNCNCSLHFIVQVPEQVNRVGSE